MVSFRAYSYNCCSYIARCLSCGVTSLRHMRYEVESCKKSICTSWVYWSDLEYTRTSHNPYPSQMSHAMGHLQRGLLIERRTRHVQVHRWPCPWTRRRLYAHQHNRIYTQHMSVSVHDGHHLNLLPVFFISIGCVGKLQPICRGNFACAQIQHHRYRHV